MSGSFSSTREVSASRRDRRCEDCGHPIPKGSPYVAVAFVSDGEFCAYDAHAECLTFAGAVLDNDGDGRPLLRDADPTEHDFEWGVRTHPPSAEMRARLSPAWIKAVDGVLSRPRPSERSA